MANKDQFDLDIQVKPVSYSVQETENTFNSRGCGPTPGCNGTAMCSVTVSCKCY